MPIDESEWQNATVDKSITLAAQEFLEDNYPQAYTPDEIVQNILPNESNQVQNNVKNNIIHRLDIVSAAGVVETRTITDSNSAVSYYRAVMD
jgi:hypothetical protein